MRRGLLLFFSLALFLPLAVQAEGIVLIVNKNNPSTSLKKGTVADMYQGVEERWSFGSKITLVNRELDSSQRAVFYQKVLGSSPDTRFYRRGTPIPVQTIVQRSDDAVKQFVAQVESAIGYISESKADNSVKVVLTVE